jgi:tetratricopeptide (TPR) repeat protein
MNIVQKIKALVEEAELYRSQGLYDESIIKYRNAETLIKENEQLKGREKLLDTIAKKLDQLKVAIEKVEQADQAPEVPAAVQQIIKDKFAFAADKDELSLEGAIALAKFGQYRAAIKEFDELTKTESHRIVAAKNIMRCHLSLDSVENAVNQYQEWLSSGMFTTDQLDNLRIFTQGLLDKKGVEQTLPPLKTPKETEGPGGGKLEKEPKAIQPVAVEEPIVETPELEIPEFEDRGLEEEDLEDISSIGITLEEGSMKGKLIELDISFHSGKEVTVIISQKKKELIEILQPGYTLNNVQFYTPYAILTGACYVDSNTKIGTGPKRGDHSLDIWIKTN